MTSQQRAILVLFEPGEVLPVGVVAKRAGQTWKSVRRRLDYLLRDGYVRYLSGAGWALTQKGIEGPRRRGRPPKPETRKRIVARSFSEKYDDPESPIYGKFFWIVRVMRCDLDLWGYRGPGHERCGRGVQGGHTAHHEGGTDEDGMRPCCGAAHDLFAGLGSARTQRAFRDWSTEVGYDGPKRAKHYVERAKQIVAGNGYLDAELNW